jgi:outer membrane protein TolC
MLERGSRIAAAAAAAVLAAAGPVAGAEEIAIESVSFDEAVSRAIENNRDVARATQSILAAEARLAQARPETLPAVALVMSESVIDEQRGFGTSVVVPRDQFAVGLVAEVPILAASSWAARVQAADQVEIANLAAEDVRREVAVAAAQAYLAVIGARRQVEVDERARDNAEAQLAFARTRYEEGAGSKLNALRAAELVATDEALVERSRLALSLAREALGLLLAADRPLDAAAEPVFDLPPAAEEIDLSGRTDLRLLAARREAADRVLQDSWKDWVPTVGLSFEPFHVEPAGAFEEADTWRATIGARFPLYLGGERRADRHLRRAELGGSTVDLDEAELRARAEVRAADAAIAAAERGLEHARRAAAHANEVLSITEIAFRAGATTNIELIDAQRAARDSETAVARAEDLLRLARLELLVALGLFPG